MSAGDDTELAMRRRLAPTDGLWSIVDAVMPKARATDPETSHAAAQKIAPRAGTAKAKLLAAHAAHPDGLTDREAAEIAGVSLQSEYATRCSELAKLGLLRDTELTRLDPDTRTARMVRRLTPLGRTVHNGR
jgi:hypothetical protein